MAIDFPASPSIGDQHTAGSIVWEYDGEKWVTLKSLFNRGILTAGTESEPGTIFNGDTDTGIYSPGSDEFGIATAGTSRVVIDSSGRLLVGTATEGQPDADNFTVEDSGNCGISIRSGTTNNGNIFFADATSGTAEYRGAIRYYHNDDALTFYSSSSERMRIDSSGNVGIGTTSPTSSLTINGNLSTVEKQNAVIGVNIATSAGNGGDLTVKSGSGSGSGNTSGNLYLASGRGGSSATNGFIAFGLSQSTNTNGLDQEYARIDSDGRLLVGTSTSLSLGVVEIPDTCIFRQGNATASGQNVGVLKFGDTRPGFYAQIKAEADATPGTNDYPGRLVFSTTADGASSPTERMRIEQTGRVVFRREGYTGNPGYSTAGVAINDTASGSLNVARSGQVPIFCNRLSNDGQLVVFAQDTTTEGSISVSGSTVSYNGAHLSRWSQLPGNAERIEILRGTVLSNIDEMCEWGDEDNEQLNRMKVSDVEGDKNVSGVFQAWDDDDDTYTNDFYCAMTGDFVIRIAQGTTVARGDLLMSAGDGTAKPQDDDIIRSKTIAKVTSTVVSETYSDGSYCVPCVLMAC